MHPFSILTLGIFVAGYITARWDLVTRLYELAIFAWDHSVVVRCRALMPTAPYISHLWGCTDAGIVSPEPQKDSLSSLCSSSSLLYLLSVSPPAKHLW